MNTTPHAPIDSRAKISNLMAAVSEVRRQLLREQRLLAANRLGGAWSILEDALHHYDVIADPTEAYND